MAWNTDYGLFLFQRGKWYMYGQYGCKEMAEKDMANRTEPGEYYVMPLDNKRMVQ